MTTKERDLLEKIFEAEVRAALTNGIHLFQTKSKLAKKLETDGLIRQILGA